MTEMSEKSSRHHSRHRGSRSGNKSQHHHHHSGHHSETRGADVVYSAKKRLVEELATQNTAMLRDSTRRLVILSAIVGVAASAGLFILEWNHYDHTALKKSSIIAILFLIVWLAGVRLFYYHREKITEMIDLISFQQSRIESIKGASFKLEKDLERAKEQLHSLGADTAESDTGGGEPDYRKLSGLS